MHAIYAYIACMKRRQTEQYTIRGVPEAVGASLRDRARREGKSLNKIAIEALMRGLGLSSDMIQSTDLDDLAGTWIEDPAFDEAIREMDRVDEETWK